jgi:AcrR family transcriptional regulator
LFRSQGYETTTVDQITRRAGLAKGTFFNYFQTKDAVLRYMGTRELGRVGGTILSTGNGTTSPLAKLKRLMNTLATSLENDRDLVCLVFQKGISVTDLLAGDAVFQHQPMASLRSARLTVANQPDLIRYACLGFGRPHLAVMRCVKPTGYPLTDRLSGIVDLLLLGITTDKPLIGPKWQRADLPPLYLWKVRRCERSTYFPDKGVPRPAALHESPNFGYNSAMQRLASGTAQLGMTLFPPQAAAFDAYTRELLAWNEQFNLTAITDPEQVEIRHYLDSLALLPALAALEGPSDNPPGCSRHGRCGRGAACRVGAAHPGPNSASLHRSHRKESSLPGAHDRRAGA